MRLAFHRDERRVRNRRCERATVFEADRTVVLAMEDQRWHADLSEQVHDVHAVDELERGRRRLGRTRLALALREPSTLLGRVLRREQISERLRAQSPVRAHQTNHGLLDLDGRKRGPVRVGTVQDKVRGALRELRGVRDRRRPTTRASQQRDPLRTKLRNQRPERGNLVLECVVGSGAVAQSDAGPVVANHGKMLRVACEHGAKRGILEIVLHVADPPGREDQQGAFAVDRIGDPRPSGPLEKADPRRHPTTLLRSGSAGQLARRSTPRVGQKHRHGSLVASIRVAEYVDQVALLVAHADEDVARQQRGQEEVSRAHRGRAPQADEHAEVERVANPAIKKRRAQDRLAHAASERLPQPEKLEVIDQVRAEKRNSPPAHLQRTNRDREGARAVPQLEADRTPLPAEKRDLCARDQHVRAALGGRRDKLHPDLLEARTRHYAVHQTEEEHEAEVDSDSQERGGGHAVIDGLRHSPAGDEPDQVREDGNKRDVCHHGVQAMEELSHNEEAPERETHSARNVLADGIARPKSQPAIGRAGVVARVGFDSVQAAQGPCATSVAST